MRSFVYACMRVCVHGCVHVCRRCIDGLLFFSLCSGEIGCDCWCAHVCVGAESVWGCGMIDKSTPTSPSIDPSISVAHRHTHTHLQGGGKIFL